MILNTDYDLQLGKDYKKMFTSASSSDETKGSSTASAWWPIQVSRVAAQDFERVDLKEVHDGFYYQLQPEKLNYHYVTTIRVAACQAVSRGFESHLPFLLSFLSYFPSAMS